MDYLWTRTVVAAGYIDTHLYQIWIYSVIENT